MSLLSNQIAALAVQYVYENEVGNTKILQDKLDCILSGNRLFTRYLTSDGEFWYMFWEPLV